MIQYKYNCVNFVVKFGYGYDMTQYYVKNSKHKDNMNMMWNFISSHPECDIVPKDEPDTKFWIYVTLFYLNLYV